MKDFSSQKNIQNVCKLLKGIGKTTLGSVIRCALEALAGRPATGPVHKCMQRMMSLGVRPRVLAPPYQHHLIPFELAVLPAYLGCPL